MSASSPVSEHHAEQLGSMLFLLRSILVHEMEKELAADPSELRMTQAQVVLRLACQGAMTAGDLARSIGHAPGALTRILDQLQHKGLVERQPHESDRRALRIALTPQGMLVQRRLHATRMKVMSRLLAGLQDAEREQLMDFMQRMLHSLQNPTDSHQV